MPPSDPAMWTMLASALTQPAATTPTLEIVTPPEHSTLVSFRPPGDPVELVARLYDVGVVVRELPGRDLVRASCGWWTNEDDLQRLVAGVTAAT